MLLANATPGNLILKKYPTFCCSQHRPDVLAPSLALLFFTHLLVFGTISRTISHSAFHRPLQRNVSSPAAGSGQRAGQFSQQQPGPLGARSAGSQQSVFAAGLNLFSAYLNAGSQVFSTSYNTWATDSQFQTLPVSPF